MGRLCTGVDPGAVHRRAAAMSARLRGALETHVTPGCRPSPTTAPATAGNPSHISSCDKYQSFSVLNLYGHLLLCILLLYFARWRASVWKACFTIPQVPSKPGLSPEKRPVKQKKRVCIGCANKKQSPKGLFFIGTPCICCLLVSHFLDCSFLEACTYYTCIFLLILSRFHRHFSYLL